MLKKIMLAAAAIGVLLTAAAATSAPASAHAHRRHWKRHGHHHHHAHVWHGRRVMNQNFVIVRNHRDWSHFRHHHNWGGAYTAYGNAAPTSCSWHFGYWHDRPAHLRVCTTAYF